MKSLRVSLVLAGMLVLFASPLSAQASRVSCKDGSKPKVGHFSCWGHGGLVTAPVKSAAQPDATAASKVAKKHKAASKAKASGKKAHSTLAKADKKKAHAKKVPKNDKT